MPFLWPSVLHVPLYKTLFFDFWFRPPNAQNLLPKMCTKSPISRLIDRRRLGLLGYFADDRFNGTMQNVVRPTLVAMAMKFGLGTETQSPTSLFLFLLSRICYRCLLYYQYMLNKDSENIIIKDKKQQTSNEPLISHETWSREECLRIPTLNLAA